MRFLFVRAYATLILFDLYLVRGNFKALYERVRRCPVRNCPMDPNACEAVCAAIDMACIWYRKEVLCLQRSAATTCLLRQYGVAAGLAMGSQQLPFKSHAWVEVDGRVVNDKPYVNQMYAVVERC